MKQKTLILPITACIISIPLPVFAVIKCVKLNPTAACSDGIGEGSRLDWSANCGGTQISGIAVCAANSATIGTVRSTVTTSDKSNANKYCYCRMISPVTSKYVYYSSNSSTDYCLTWCASGCQQAMTLNPDFASKMLNAF